MLRRPVSMPRAKQSDTGGGLPLAAPVEPGQQSEIGTAAAALRIGLRGIEPAAAGWA